MSNVADEVLDAPAAITEYNAVQKGLAELRKDLAGVQFDVTTTAGDKAARAARSRCVSIRTSADSAYEGWNKPMLAKQREMRAILASIKDEVKAVEEPIDAQIKAEEARKAEIKAAKEAAELARAKAIQERLDHIRDFASSAAGLSSAKIEAMRETLAEFPLTTELYEHRTGEAMQLHAEVMAKLDQMHGAALAQEQEAARLAEERAALERQRLEQEAEAQRQREAEAAQLAQQRAELEEQQRRLQAERAAEDARQEAALAIQARRDAEAAAALKRQQDDAAAALRAQQDAAHKMEMAMQEIQGIQQQVAIAISGRLGVRKGGTTECIRETLAETEAWTIDADRFGMLTSAAQAAKDSAIAEMRRLLADAERKEAEARAQQEKEAAARAEAEAAERERLAEQARREEAEFLANGPGNAEIVAVLAQHYGVEQVHVLTWLAKFTNPAMADLAA